WEVSTATGELRRLTDDPADDWDPAFSRDGSSIYWSSDRSKAFEIWAAHRDGSAPHQVSQDSLDAENPAGAPDGNWILYSSSNPTKPGLWRVPSKGGKGERLITTSTLIPELSPDGHLVSVITGTGTLMPRLSVFDLERRQVLPFSVDVRIAQSGQVVMGRS